MEVKVSDVPLDDISMDDVASEAEEGEENVEAQGPRFSNWALLFLSLLGSAIGTGNIWRFPRVVAQAAGEHGAGAIMISWVMFLFIWSIPLIIAENALGKWSRRGLLDTFGKAWSDFARFMGFFMGFVAYMIGGYYAVVSGWCWYFFGYYVFHSLPIDDAETQLIWNEFQDSWYPQMCHALVLSGTFVCMVFGLKGIEKVSWVMVPILLLILIFTFARALFLPHALTGLLFLFTPQLDLLLVPSTWLESLTQNAYDTSAGWGIYLTYATYMPESSSILATGVITPIGNNCISLLSAGITFMTVFSVMTERGYPTADILEVMKDSGPASTGLTFMWMPTLYAQMGFGRVFCVLFFLGLGFASFTSLIALLAIQSRVISDLGIKRVPNTFLIVFVVYLIGIPSSFNLDFLSNQDFVWGVALLVSGSITAACVVSYGALRMMESGLAGASSQALVKFYVYSLALGAARFATDLIGWASPVKLIPWSILMTFLVPIEAVLLLSWWAILSVTKYEPDNWWNPYSTFSVMTLIVQIGFAFFIPMLLNFLIPALFMPIDKEALLLRSDRLPAGAARTAAVMAIDFLIQ